MSPLRSVVRGEHTEMYLLDSVVRSGHTKMSPLGSVVRGGHKRGKQSSQQL